MSEAYDPFELFDEVDYEPEEEDPAVGSLPQRNSKSSEASGPADESRQEEASDSKDVGGKRKLVEDAMARKEDLEEGAKTEKRRKRNNEIRRNPQNEDEKVQYTICIVLYMIRCFL